MPLLHCRAQPPLFAEPPQDATKWRLGGLRRLGQLGRLVRLGTQLTKFVLERKMKHMAP